MGYVTINIIADRSTGRTLYAGKCKALLRIQETHDTSSCLRVTHPRLRSAEDERVSLDVSQLCRDMGPQGSECSPSLDGVAQRRASSMKLQAGNAAYLWCFLQCCSDDTLHAERLSVTRVKSSIR